MVINSYSDWNSALFDHFFPKGCEDPILYLDDSLLDQIAKDRKITLNHSTAVEDFLSKTLLDNNAVDDFLRNWKIVTGNQPRCTVKNWEDIVVFLNDKTLYNKPASFAMLCAILYVAERAGIDHNRIKQEISNYCGYKPRKAAEYVDDLMQSLHKSTQSFNPDHTACGNQRNMSRIKYQLVLRQKDRDDFIDFVEVNDLEWKYGQFTEFVNNKLIPALNRGGKYNLVQKVIIPENIPYFKNLLLKPLLFGKPVSTNNNSLQDKTLLWYYEMEFDFFGHPSFNIISEDNRPFAISLNSTSFSVNGNADKDVCIASGVSFTRYASQVLVFNKVNYIFSNISPDWNTIYFKCVGPDYYRQVLFPEQGGRYIRLTKLRNPSPFGVNIALEIPEYQAEEVIGYNASAKTNRTTNNSRLQDSFELYGVGSYFRINLKDGQQVFWHPDRVGADTQPIETTIGKDGFYYFKLLKNTRSNISGSVVVKQEKHDDYYDHITDDFLWDGVSQLYTIDGWGEATKLVPVVQNIPANTGKWSLAGRGSNIPTSPRQNMLLQILFDLADENGCLNQSDMREAVDFVLQFYGITPSTTTRNNVIYALRSLGYVISYYDSASRTYLNQLFAPYLEKTNYSISASNAYLVKGVYQEEQLADLIDGVSPSFIKYLKPYSPESLLVRPEYICLPDLILIDTNNLKGWKIEISPIASRLVAIMENMSQFTSSYNINGKGDIYVTTTTLQSPCIILDTYGKEVLCVKDSSNVYRTYKYHVSANGQCNFIPRDLSRTYCQNQKDIPVCMMSLNSTGNIDFSTIRIIKGMGLPLILDIAFCDLNLGLPTYHDMFVVNSGRYHFSDNGLIISGRIFKTNATSSNNVLLKTAIEKWSGRTVGNFNNTNAIHLYKRQGRNSIYMTKQEMPNHKKQIILYTKDIKGIRLEAFSIGTDVYALTGNNTYHSVKGTSLNDKLSAVINGNPNLGTHLFNDAIPDINAGIEVDILI